MHEQPPPVSPRDPHILRRAICCLFHIVGVKNGCIRTFSQRSSHLVQINEVEVPPFNPQRQRQSRQPPVLERSSYDVTRNSPNNNIPRRGLRETGTDGLETDLRLEGTVGAAGVADVQEREIRDVEVGKRPFHFLGFTNEL